MSTDEEREALIDALTTKRPHKISGNAQGGYDCTCGARWDWTRTEEAAAKRHAARPTAEAILALGFRRYGPITDEMVKAANDAYFDHLTVPLARFSEVAQRFQDDMRAALEAAEAAR